MKVYKICSKRTILSRECPKSAKKLTENCSHLEFLINAWCYHIYNIPIGFSDLEKVGLDTKFCVYRLTKWPRYEQFNFRKISMAAILKSAQKGGGGLTNKALTSRLLISGVPRTKWYHSWMILGGWGGGAARWPLWAHGLMSILNIGTFSL